MLSTPLRALSTLVEALTQSDETVRLSNMYSRLGQPLLELDQIQGNVLAGLNKDYQDVVSFDIEDVEQFKWWPREHVGDVATSSGVLAFNDLFKDLKRGAGVARSSTRPGSTSPSPTRACRSLRTMR